MKWILIRPEADLSEPAERFEVIFSAVLSKCGGRSAEIIQKKEDLIPLLEDGDAFEDSRILFAVFVGNTGINLALHAMLREIRLRPRCMRGAVAGIIVDGTTELYTKQTARAIAFTINQAGCALIGSPLVEGTGSLKNFLVRARNQDVDCMQAYLNCAVNLCARLEAFRAQRRENPRLLCVHSSNFATSNTLSLWNRVKKKLPPEIQTREISLRNGEIRDCIGCPYETCMYFSRSSSCYFGGTMVEKVYPALKECDALLLLCPNYNDALGANLTAFINRLTALYRAAPFMDKTLFAIIVSGYSGSDLVASQLIDGLNMNKSFLLPGEFCLMETAHAAGSIDRTEGIQQKAEDFAARITRQLLPCSD